MLCEFVQFFYVCIDGGRYRGFVLVFFSVVIVSSDILCLGLFFEFSPLLLFLLADRDAALN